MLMKKSFVKPIPKSGLKFRLHSQFVSMRLMSANEKKCKQFILSPTWNLTTIIDDWWQTNYTWHTT
jgi:hypothetical protein